MQKATSDAKKHNLFLEIAIILLILALSIGAYFLFFHHTEQGSRVTLSGNGTILGEYSLEGEKLILIEKTGGDFTVTEISAPYSVSDFKENYNLLLIKDGTARIIEADCPARGSTRCTNQGEKRYSGDNIICLEHGLTVTISGSKEGELDLGSR